METCYLNVCSLFFVFNGLIQTILVAYLMETFKACTDMLPLENDEFKLIKKM